MHISQDAIILNIITHFIWTKSNKCNKTIEFDGAQHFRERECVCMCVCGTFKWWELLSSTSFFSWRDPSSVPQCTFPKRPCPKWFSWDRRFLSSGVKGSSLSFLMKRDGFITAIYLPFFLQVLDVSSESVFSTSAQTGHSALTLVWAVFKRNKSPFFPPNLSYLFSFLPHRKEALSTQSTHALFFIQLQFLLWVRVLICNTELNTEMWEISGHISTSWGQKTKWIRGEENKTPCSICYYRISLSPKIEWRWYLQLIPESVYTPL